MECCSSDGGPGGRHRSAGPAGGGGYRRRRLAIFAAAVLVAAAAVTLARIGVSDQPQPGFTQLWLSPARQKADTLILGISNNQGSTTSYRLVLLTQ